jgi:hypothetical protein
MKLYRMEFSSKKVGGNSVLGWDFPFFEWDFMFCAACQVKPTDEGGFTKIWDMALALTSGSLILVHIHRLGLIVQGKKIAK